MKILMVYMFSIILALGVSITVTTGVGYLLGFDPNAIVGWAFHLTPVLAIGLIYFVFRRS